MSAFVLPETMPASDDGRQMPMFGSEDDVRSLIDVLRIQAEAVRETAAINRKLLKRQRSNHRPKTLKTPQSEPGARRHVPRNEEYRDWASFRAEFQRLEQIVRRDRQMRPEDRVTKDMFWAVGAPSAKTIDRIMVETHGLSRDQWPPSTWPVEPPLKG